MNWRYKAALQFVFGHAPFGERLNYFAQCANGAFSDAALLSSVCAKAKHIRNLNERHPIRGASVVEIGTGWTGVGSIVLSLFGARVRTYDNRAHLRHHLFRRAIGTAVRNIDRVSAFSGLPQDRLRERLDEALSSPDPLRNLHITYVAPGDASSTGLPAQSVDLVYSYGTLEHIPLDVIRAILTESRCILKTGGLASHYIGMQDHYAGGVHFLRYPDWLYRLAFCHKVHYHNRLRLPDFMSLFASHGFSADWSDTRLPEDALRTARTRPIAARFRGLSEKELATTALYVDLKTLES